MQFQKHRASRTPATQAVAPPWAGIQAMIMNGQRGEAVEALRRIAGAASHHPQTLAQSAQLLTQAAAHAEALDCHKRLAVLLPGHPEVLQALAAAETACGHLAEAEAHLDQAIAIDPLASDAWYNRAVLRRQTLTKNHIDALRQRLAGPIANTRAAIPLHFALGKSLEDLGRHSEAFAAISRGAGLRRAALSYQVQTDCDAMAQIATVFNAARLAMPAAGASEARPIVIVGLPRTGSTLLERMLGAHAAITSLGELTELPLAVTRFAAGPTKHDTIARAGSIDFSALGHAYLRAIASYAPARPITTDKLPSNFLYIGLLRLALPRARIVHLTRSPMDTAWAIYKTLFRMGYPYSYDLADLAAYMQAYRRLMAHWHAACPGYVHDIAYEDLVRSPEQTLRALCLRMDLPWDPACLDHQENPSPVATASAAQANQPIYASSIGLWRHHEAALHAAGIH